MSKKRRTRSQKIIANLRRQLGQKPVISPSSPVVLPKNITPIKEVKTVQVKEAALLSYPARLIKKDLKKTIILSLIFITGIFFIKLFFHL